MIIGMVSRFRKEAGTTMTGERVNSRRMRRGASRRHEVCMSE
jgi:hypothetical protein